MHGKEGIMAKIYRTCRKRRNQATGKKTVVLGPDGKPILHPKWRVTILSHKGKRRTYTLGRSKAHAQKHADMLEQQELEIRNGLRPAPDSEAEKSRRPFDEVLDEYISWGKIQGGRRGLPWDDVHARKKERDILFWRDTLGLKEIGDACDILPQVEAECRKMFEAGNCGKTVWNKVQTLRTLFLWCWRRRYLTENPLRELGKFNTEPISKRRAMTLEEYHALLRHSPPHLRLLYEVAACSGLRENELRQLKIGDLDRINCTLRIDRMIDKGRLDRLQFIPAELAKRLAAAADSREAEKLYEQIYRGQGKRPGNGGPPMNPLLYVPASTTAMLKRGLAAAGIPSETKDGRLDFHALRTAYINFLLDVGAPPKELQDLARHQTLDMTMNVYGRVRSNRKRNLVEALGAMLHLKKSS